MAGSHTDITERKQALEQITRMQRELVDASRQAGMAEVATGVLHNVGNVLNSVNISAALVVEQLRKSKTASLAKAVKLLSEHKDDMGEFLTSDPKGKQLPPFFEAVSEHLTREQAMLTKETQGLQQNIDHIKQIVAMQQSYAKVSGALENLAPHDLVEDALRMSSTALARHQIEVVRQFDSVSPVLVDRHKVLQILINLVNNARQAMDVRPEGRRLTLRIAQNEGGRVRVEVADNGTGIPAENLARIFNHGFTTKKTGHGFGLHSGANAAKEIGGSLNVHSDGLGTGATFILELPSAEAKLERQAA
jgi:C4-dicarboxylate-specific signal transduction histidine kinase